MSFLGRMCASSKIFGWPRFLQTVCAAALVLLAFQPASAAGNDYKLGAQDKLRLKVFEWRAPIDTVYEWTALNGDFVVGPSGTISLPLIGEVMASERTTQELANAIAQQMAERINLRSPPEVAVEVTEYRPFFIVGAVAKPGAYPYQPGLTVLRALSIAGGLPRPAESGFTRLGREVITGRGNVKQLAFKTKELLARKARLQAELQQKDELTFPEELIKLKDDSDVSRILGQEETIFNAKRTALTTQINTLVRLKSYLIKEVSSLEEQVRLKQSELKIVEKELGNVVKLVDKGLSVSSRQFSLERLSAELSSERLRLETTLLKAQQEISRTDVSIDEAQNRNAIEVATQLRTTDAELEEAASRYQTEEKLLYESEILFPRLLTARRRKSDDDEAKYAIVRSVDGKPQEMAANELMEVLPGDTIKVELPIPDSLSSIILAPPGTTQ